MPRTAKVAISLPSDVLTELERLRSETGESRSALVQRAIRQLIRDRRREERISRYIEGYRQRPESPAEIEAAERAAIDLFASEPWT